MISERDPRFVLHFWRPLITLLGTGLELLTAYHPESSRSICMVSCYSFLLERDWDMFFLAITTELARNSACIATIGKTPFEVIFGRVLLRPGNFTGSSDKLYHGECNVLC